MLDKLKYTVKQTAIYSIGGMANKLIGIILLPLYTGYLTAYEYGVLSILEITNQVLISIIGMRLSTAMMRWYNTDKGVKKGSIVFSALIGILLSIFIFNSITQPFVDSYSNLFFNSGDYSMYFRYLLMWGSLEILNLFIADLIRIKEQPLFFVVITSIKLVVILVLNIIFIAKLKLGVIGIIYGNTIGAALFLLFTSVFLIKNISFQIHFEVLRNMLKFSLPLIFTSISNLLLSLGDRYFIKHFLDYSEVGIYSLGYKIVNVIRLVFIQSFQMGFIPIAYKMFNDKNTKEFFARIFNYFMLGIIFVSILVLFFSFELLTFISNDVVYIEAYQYIPLFTIAVVLRGAQVFFTLGFHYSKKTQKSAVILLGALIISLTTNYFLIPVLGLYGACISAIGSNIYVLIFYYKTSQRYYRLPYELKKIGVITIIYSVYIAIFYLTVKLNINTHLAFIIKVLLVLLLPFLFIQFKFFNATELKRIKENWRKWRNPGVWKDNLPF